ncbi:MAG: hypothetical protein AB7K68_10770 [Bacteriovoracia bacterium]
MQPLFPFHAHSEPIGVEGKIELTGLQNLTLKFQLADPRHLVLDSLAIHTERDLFRADGLWHTTCFEAFWGIPGEAGYWELNLSPTQPKWNLYKFSDYRKPAPPQESGDFRIAKLEVNPSSLTCHLTSKNKLDALEASLCVILRTSQATHFYSTNHAGQQPDYHLRESFTLKLKN